ncbi:MAG TPA: hypothetical protein VLN08_16735 [Vicinamibacterales bacterium]|nr:hypothetical protein [Vicinamibacterales bacterium]
MRIRPPLVAMVAGSLVIGACGAPGPAPEETNSGVVPAVTLQGFRTLTRDGISVSAGQVPTRVAVVRGSSNSGRS